MNKLTVVSGTVFYGSQYGRFTTPNGLQCHIAPCPRTAQLIREKLGKVHQDGTFDVYIHGSTEHVEALQNTYNHRKELQEKLKQEFGDRYEEIEAIHQEVDLLSTQLRLLTDYDVALSATFSKYGYGAHVRTYDRNFPSSLDHNCSHESSRPPSLKPSDGFRDEESSMRFYKQPVIRQYFHKGFLWRASGFEEVGPFELFVDLFYVGLIDTIGKRLSNVPTGEHFHRYIIFIFLSWKIWNDLMLHVSWFETNDLIQRGYILLTVTCLFGFSTNMLMAFAGKTWPELISFYIAARLVFSAYCLLQAYFVPLVRGMMIASVLTALLPLSLWVGSIWVELPERFAIIWVALAFDSFGMTWSILLQRNGHNISEHIQRWFDQHFEIYPAINIEHKSERIKQFVTLMIGSQIINILYQNAASFGLNAFFGKAILGLLQGFAINWIYFDIDSNNLQVHAIRRHVASSLFWLSIHLPFIMGLGLAGAASSRLVIAHDCNNAAVHELASLIENYEEASIGAIPDGLRWLYCGGSSIVCLTMTAISCSHIHKEFKEPRIKKAYRLLYRAIIGFIMLGLSVVRSLNSLQMIATITALICSVLAVDIYGISSKNVSFFAPTKSSLEALHIMEDFEHPVVVATEKMANDQTKPGQANTGQTSTDKIIIEEMDALRTSTERVPESQDIAETNLNSTTIDLTLTETSGSRQMQSRPATIRIQI